jgi:hypothetical protein
MDYLTGRQKTNGILVGEDVGLGMLMLRANDGLDSSVPYVQRLPARAFTSQPYPAPPLGTRMPHVMPLALDSASQFRPDGPPALRSKEYTRDFSEVKSMGALTAACEAREQTAVAPNSRTDHDIAQWNRNLLRLVPRRAV